MCLSLWPGKSFIISEGSAECEWIRGVLESAVYRDNGLRLHRHRSINLPNEPTLTVMKADRAFHFAPSTVCIVDAKSALDHFMRESTGGHRCRTAQELRVIRGSMQTVRAKYHWMSHDSMVADALTKRHGNNVTMLKFLKTRQLNIVDEDKEQAEERQFREVHGRNPRLHRQHEDNNSGQVEWGKRCAVGCTKTIPRDSELEANLSMPRLQRQCW